MKTPILVEPAPVASRVCRSCGCTDDHACWPTCWWVEADLCSACAMVIRRQALGGEGE